MIFVYRKIIHADVEETEVESRPFGKKQHTMIACIEGIYCVSCAEYLINRLTKKFVIEHIDVDAQNRTLAISSHRRIDKDEFERLIRKLHYGKVTFEIQKMKGGR